MVWTLLGLVICTGCAHTAALFERAADRARFRQERVEEAQAERERNLAIKAEKRRMELESQHSQCDQNMEDARRQTADSLRSKVSLDLDQSLRLGQLQVDVTKLKELLAQREKENEEANKLHAEIEKQFKARQKDAALAEAKRIIDGLDRKTENATAACGHPSCCSAGCQNPHCWRHHMKSCEGPSQLNALAQRMPDLPAQRALQPTEIPLMIPVFLDIGFDNPRIEEARVRKVPTLNALGQEEARRQEAEARAAQCAMNCPQPCPQSFPQQYCPPAPVCQPLPFCGPMGYSAPAGGHVVAPPADTDPAPCPPAKQPGNPGQGSAPATNSSHAPAVPGFTGRTASTVVPVPQPLSLADASNLQRLPPVMGTATPVSGVASVGDEGLVAPGPHASGPLAPVVMPASNRP